MSTLVKRRYIAATVVFAAINLALALYLIFYEPGRISYDLPNLPIISLSGIDELVVERESGTLTFNRTSDGWVINPGGYRADPGIAADMVNAVAAIDITDVVSASGDMIRYDLGPETRIALTLKNNGETLREVYLGKKASTFNHTYAGLPDDDRVFQATGELRFMFEQVADEYRYKRVLSFDPATITSVSLDRQGSRTTITKSEDGVWRSGIFGVVSSETVNSLVTDLSRLNAYRFRYDGDPLTNPVVTIELQGEESYSLSLYELESNRYPATSSGIPDSFFLLQFRGNTILETIDGIVSPAE